MLAGVSRQLAEPIGDDNTTRYLSFTVRPEGRLNAGIYDGFFGLVLDQEDSTELFFGKGGSKVLHEWVLKSRGGGGQVATGVALKLNATALLVLQMEFHQGNDRFTLYVNPGAVEPEKVRSNRMPMSTSCVN